MHSRLADDVGFFARMNNSYPVPENPGTPALPPPHQLLSMDHRVILEKEIEYSRYLRHLYSVVARLKSDHNNISDRMEAIIYAVRKDYRDTSTRDDLKEKVETDSRVLDARHALHEIKREMGIVEGEIKGSERDYDTLRELSFVFGRVGNSAPGQSTPPQSAHKPMPSSSGNRRPARRGG